MWLPSDPNKFSSKFKYVEFAKWAYSEKQNRWSVFRDTMFTDKETPRKAVLYTWDEINSKIDHDGVGYYSSIFAHSSRDINQSQSMANLYFDLDSDDEDKSLHEARILYGHLRTVAEPESIRIYFSGKKGYHIEVEALAIGLGPSSDLVDTFRFIANELARDLELSTIDFQCYDSRRMWRIPNTKHQGTNLYKVALRSEELLGMRVDEIKEIALNPRLVEPIEQEFNFKLNEWFREHTYKRQQEQVTPEQRIQRFMKHGSGMVRDVDDLEFDPTCFGKCEALGRLWSKAEDDHHLEHNERLFLCSLLTYSEEAIEYLHAILSNCDDYMPDKTESHIRDWIKRREFDIGGRPFSCDKAKLSGVPCSSCHDLPPKERYETVGNRMIPTGEMAAPSPVRFAYSKKTKTQ